MPLYDYLCLDCGHEYESSASSDDRTGQCPHCESQKVDRLPPLIGGYQGSFGGGSTKPRQAGSFKGKVRK